MKNILIRSLTGAIYVALIVVSILYNQYTFAALFALITLLCLNEFYGLLNARKGLTIKHIFHSAGGLIIFVSTYLHLSGKVGGGIYLLCLAYIVFTLVAGLYSKKHDAILHSSAIFLGQIYIALPLALLNILAFPENAYSAPYYSQYLLSLFVFLWVNDTGAYLTGMSLGKHRLFPRISPKKSWEGFFGGLLFTSAASLIFAYFEPQTPLLHWLLLAVMTVALGTWGDLVESLFKRTLDVKDSGKTLPGHGGFLDRFDSLLLAVYGYVFYILLAGN